MALVTQGNTLSDPVWGRNPRVWERGTLAGRAVSKGLPEVGSEF